MLDYGFALDVAEEVYRRLNIPEDMSARLDKTSVKDFGNQYSREYIRSLVDEVMQDYDWSDNVPSDIEDLKENATDEVEFKLQMIEDAFWENNSGITEGAYNEIVEVLQNASFKDVVDIDVEYEGPDYDVGIFGEERRIVFTLSNGEYITFEVKFDD